MIARAFGVGCAAVSVFVAGCTAIAGIDGFEVDPCYDGCTEGGLEEGGGGDGSTNDTGHEASSTDGPVDSPVDAPTSLAGLSSVTASGTGVAVGKTGVATLITKDNAGTVVPRTGARVVFTASGGTSVLSFGPVTDVGGGTYRATYTGTTEGTKLSVSATIDDVPLITPPASVRVVNPVDTSLTFSLDAQDADGAGNFGGQSCAASGLATWTDLSSNAFAGTLTGFGAPPCGPGASGWSGDGTPENPFRLAFDGVDDNVNFGAVNSLAKQTVIAWIRKKGNGFTGTSGGGGLAFATPIITKGTSESGTDAVDMNFFLGLSQGGQLATDFENLANSNFPLIGTTVLSVGTWYMIALTLDASAGQRFLYVNGKQDASSAITSTPSPGPSSFLVVGGARRTDGTGTTVCPGAPNSSGCGRFNGEIAAVRTYDRALTKVEIERNCHSFSSRFGMTTCPN